MRTTDAFTRGQDLIKTIIRKMTQIDKWQQDFMQHIFLLCLSMGGRFNFLQMGREGRFHEHTYRNNFSKSFDFMKFNLELVSQTCSEDKIIGFDPSYISKSGKHTHGMGYYYSGCASTYKRGLEIGGLAIIDVKQNTAYHLEAIQSPTARKQKVNEKGYSLVDHYTELIVERAELLQQHSKLLVVDGYFAKAKFVNGICNNTELEIICRLRDDANLRYLYNGAKSSKRGRPKKFSGKVDTKNIDKSRYIKIYSDDEMIIYSAIVYSISLQRNIKTAYVQFLNDEGNVGVAKIFFSTDLDLSAIEIVKYYKARFQMEYLYRDSKQFTGLEHGQARSEEKLYFHFNTCLTSISIGKAILRSDVTNTESKSLSISDLKTEFKNRKMIYRIFSMYGFDHNLIKNNRKYRKLLNYGKIAA